MCTGGRGLAGRKLEQGRQEQEKAWNKVHTDKRGKQLWCIIRKIENLWMDIEWKIGGNSHQTIYRSILN